MQLAKLLRRPSPSAMLSEMRPSELGLWTALWVTDPWDENRDDLRAGVISAVIANVNRDPSKHPGGFRPVEFMPYAIVDQETRDRDLSRRLRAALSARRVS